MIRQREQVTLIPGSGLVLIVVLLAAYYLLPITIEAVRRTEHATESHAVSDVNAIRSCLSKNGSYQNWKIKGTNNEFVRLCEVSKNTWGIQIVRRIKGKFIEKTAFIPKDGSWARVIEYLRKFATRIK